jgi:hypothetical protein
MHHKPHVRLRQIVEVQMIKMTASAIALAMMTTGALAQQTTTNPPVPSSQNSGAGISGAPGNKNGPAAQQPGTVGSATNNQTDRTVKDQDAAGIKGQPGNKNGPPAKTPSR